MAQTVAPARDSLRARIEKDGSRELLSGRFNHEHGFIVFVPPEDQAVRNTAVVSFAEGLDIVQGAIILGAGRGADSGEKKENKHEQAQRNRRAG